MSEDGGDEDANLGFGDDDDQDPDAEIWNEEEVPSFENDDMQIEGYDEEREVEINEGADLFYHRSVFRNCLNFLSFFLFLSSLY